MSSTNHGSLQPADDASTRAKDSRRRRNIILAIVGVVALVAVVGAGSYAVGHKSTSSPSTKDTAASRTTPGSSSPAVLPSQEPTASPTVATAIESSVASDPTSVPAITPSRPFLTPQATAAAPTVSPRQTAAVTPSAKTSRSPAPDALPAFGQLELSLEPACNAQAGVTTAEARLTWRVINATGIETGIDNTNPADATQFSTTSGSQQLTLLHCDTDYTFDVWTIGGAGGKQAHRQLSFHPSSPTQPPTPTPALPAFSQLRLDLSPACNMQAGVATSEATIIWQVANATGIEVGIDDSNPADATQFTSTSGSQQLTLVHCDTAYTFDVWTIGGAGGKQAHQQLSYHPS